MQQHSTFICDPHVRGCECGPDQLWCNPYSVEGYCPTEGAGDECEADPSKLIVLTLTDGGFTHVVLS
ncbi:hypothetical protein LCGC14_1832350 [marine sediment metagenome]|uniref:Uncharacterized protein n=1 Tax=marine sediment metagenome TaxID=412755 RepID=A0A0F9JF70_9ZZZZ